jgi:hypothetical protein
MPSPLPPPVPFSELDERVDNALDRWFSGPRGWLPAREESDEKEDGKFLRHERRYGSFSRSMTVPADWWLTR